MFVKVKEKSEKTKQTKNIDESKKYILQGKRIVRYHDRVLPNKNKSYNITFFF